ncbi:transposase [Burkholderia pseudomultivorans]|uniref:transposase n=1 Tax=Burkholderia pseudomultivorans TaxID=1207504 RepID=UPI0038F69196
MSSTPSPEVQSHRPPLPCGRGLTDCEWQQIADLFAGFHRRNDPRGRPARSHRAVFDAILWKISTRRPWSDIPEHFPVYQTCHRYFITWIHSGILSAAFCRLYGKHAKEMMQCAESQLRRKSPSTGAASGENR